MNQFKNKTLKELLDAVDQMILNSGDTPNYMIQPYLFTAVKEFHLSKMVFEQTNALCDFLLKQLVTNNKDLQAFEIVMWEEMPELPLKFMVYNSYLFEDYEDLNLESNYRRNAKNSMSRILKLSFDVLKLEKDNSIVCGHRRVNALKTITELRKFYTIDGSRQFFWKSINSTNLEEQLEGLKGLDAYFDLNGEEIEEDLLENINKIISESKNREIIETCYQIKVKANETDRTDALFNIHHNLKNKHLI